LKPLALGSFAENQAQFLQVPNGPSTVSNQY
jgi:hypothetical protein